MSYVLLVSALLLVALVVRLVGELHARSAGRTIPLLPTLIAAAALVILTAIFDNVMIAAGLFVYVDGNISGLHIGLAPLEDFAYPVALAILLPGFWELWTPRKVAIDA